MNITEVNISLRNEGKLKGFANIVLEDLFLVRDLKIIRGMNKYFIAMPSRKQKNGDYIDIAHPIKHDFRIKMEKIILNKYWEKVKQIQRENSSTSKLEIRQGELGVEYE
ncbi:SpoVG family protein [bacterium]|nr:SpoVG family protein [bacterium]